MQIIPFKRDNWKMKISNSNVARNSISKALYPFRFIHNYKTDIWKKTVQVDPYDVGQYAKVIDDLFPAKTMDIFYKICQTLDFEDVGVGGNPKPKINKKIRNTKGVVFTRYDKN